MNAPDTIEDVYSEVIEQYSKEREDSMKSLMAILVRTTDEDAMSPDKHHDPLDNQTYLGPFVFARFQSWRGFATGFVVYVVDTLTAVIDEARNSNMVSPEDAILLLKIIERWMETVRCITTDIEKSAIACNAEYTTFCTQAKITDIFTKTPLLYQSWGLDIQAVEGALVAVELDLEVLRRIIKSPITNSMFGGEAIVVKNGKERVVARDSIADLL